MTTLFGVPLEQIMVVLLVICVSVTGMLVFLALRHRMLLALALRNIPRRRAQTLLIVVGLGLSTAIVSSSFSTGDTMTYTARSLIADTLGRVDEVIVSLSLGRDRRLGPDGLSGLTTGYFSQSDYDRLRPGLLAIPGVAGVTPAISESVSLVDASSQQSKSQVTLIGLPVDYDLAFRRLVRLDDRVATLAELGPDELYLNREGADSLDAAAGDEIQLYIGSQPIKRHLKAVLHNGGPGGAQPVALMPLPQLQQLRDRVGQVNQVYVANLGDELSGDRWSASVISGIRQLLIDDKTAHDVRDLVLRPSVRASIDASVAKLRDTDRPIVAEFLAEATASTDSAVTPRFKSLLGDPMLLRQLGQLAFRMSDRDAGNELFRLLRSSSSMSVSDVKHQGLIGADQVGAVMTSLFVGLGLFSIASGMLLIFLIFVMLAAERRTEMGMARAIGTQRAHLVEMFLFEGACYDLGAALAGMLVGLGVGYAIVAILSALLTTVDVRVHFHVERQSLVVAFCTGLVLTFITVGASAWRVSRLNIVAAIRNLPDTAKQRGGTAMKLRELRRFAANRQEEGRLVVSIPRLVLRLLSLLAVALFSVAFSGPLLAILGGALALVSRNSSVLLPVRALGTSLFIVGLALSIRLLLRLCRLPASIVDRLCFTAAGLGLLGYWASPFNLLRAMRPRDLQAGVELYFLAGIAMVAGAVWAVVYNADALVLPLTSLLGRIFPITAVLRTAAAYALRQRFRTGMALAMFALVIFTMVVASVLSTASNEAYGNLSVMQGGFDIRGDTQTDRPILDIRPLLATASGVKESDLAAVGGVALMPGVAIETTAADAVWHTISLNAVDDGFLAGSRFHLTARARGYRDDAAVWQAMRTTPGLAVVDGLSITSAPGDLIARRSFALSRVFRGQTSMAPATVWVRNQNSGTPVKLTVIGVLDPRTSFGSGITSSSATFGTGMKVPASSTFYFRVAPGKKVDQVSKGLGLSFVEYGLQTQVLADQLRKTEGVRLLLNQLIQGYMGLGLVVGVAALGVISTRAVVERRQHIGMLRALGFQRRMIQVSFLLEAAFVAFGGVALGIALGLQLAHSLTNYIGRDHPEIIFTVPWLQLLTISTIACGASLVATWFPARRASRVLPAEALRYE